MIDLNWLIAGWVTAHVILLSAVLARRAFGLASGTEY